MGDARPVLTYTGKALPFAVLGAISLTGAEVEEKLVPDLPKDFAPELAFPSGCATQSAQRAR